MTSFTCLDSDYLSDLYFHGTTISPESSYFHIELNKCEEELLHQVPGYEDATCATEQEVNFFFATHFFIGYMSNTFVNKTEFDQSPISTLNDLLFYE